MHRIICLQRLEQDKFSCEKDAEVQARWRCRDFEEYSKLCLKYLLLVRFMTQRRNDWRPRAVTAYQYIEKPYLEVMFEEHPFIPALLNTTESGLAEYLPFFLTVFILLPGIWNFRLCKNNNRVWRWLQTHICTCLPFYDKHRIVTHPEPFFASMLSPQIYI